MKGAVGAKRITCLEGRVNRFVQVETMTNVPGLFCCIEKRWSTTALQNASETTASGMAATFWSAAVFCRFLSALHSLIATLSARSPPDLVTPPVMLMLRNGTLTGLRSKALLKNLVRHL
jgi:hypothetical protein